LGIVTEAWSPLAQGGLLDHPVLAGIAREHDRSPTQVVLRWHVQLGNVVIPKSVTPSRINIDVFDFELSEDEMTAVAGVNRGQRIGPHPNEFTG
jgi:diketogulonate reductase-like aldo/keto reductase